MTEWLKIMDPKMDSGYLADGETLEDKYDVLRDLSPEEVIGIMDQLLCFEVRLSVVISDAVHGWTVSDADLGIGRWLGIWVFLCLSPCSPLTTLIICCGQSQKILMKPASTAATRLHMGTSCFTSC